MSRAWVDFRGGLLLLHNPREDSLRFYRLGANWRSRARGLAWIETPITLAIGRSLGVARSRLRVD